MKSIVENYLISGIGPGDSGGVARLMKTLAPSYERDGFKLIYNRDKLSLRRLFSSGKYIVAMIELISRLFDKIFFFFKCVGIKNSNIVVVHPQTVGYQILFKLIKSNTVSVYVMDCSFFCIRSYNTHPISNRECLECIGKINPHIQCEPFPSPIPKQKNIEYLTTLSRLSKQIHFLAQNIKQKELLLMHFGATTKVSVIGMDTKEVSHHINDSKCVNSPKIYNVVFHGVPHVAKGLLYLIRLAEILPNYSFLIPSSYLEVLKQSKRKNLPDNVDCIDLNWETGLESYVRCADLVINPSLWSAPIEGALVKSAAYNKVVATVRSEYGFESEIKSIRNHLRLSPNTETAAKQLNDLLSFPKHIE